MPPERTDSKPCRLPLDRRKQRRAYPYRPRPTTVVHTLATEQYVGRTQPWLSQDSWTFRIRRITHTHTHTPACIDEGGQNVHAVVGRGGERVPLSPHVKTKGGS